MSRRRHGQASQRFRLVSVFLLVVLTTFTTTSDAFLVMTPTSSLARATPRQRLRMQDSYLTSLQEVTNTTITGSSSTASPVAVEGGKEKKKVVVIGAGWGGLSAAYELAKRCVINLWEGHEYHSQLTPVVFPDTTKVGRIRRDAFGGRALCGWTGCGVEDSR